jgi:hypothetical protein
MNLILNINIFIILLSTLKIRSSMSTLVIVNMEKNENLAGGGKEYKDTIQIQAIL